MNQISPKDRFESPYYDFLQAPLQPLMDNLESETYETFEKDPIKYEQYEAAILAALQDTPPTKQTVLMVVGAGRGPLVRAAIRATKESQRHVRIYATACAPEGHKKGSQELRLLSSLPSLTCRLLFSVALWPRK